MLTSDILPPRTVSSRGMLAMLKRLETDTPNQYTFKLLPPSALDPVALARGGNAEGKGGPYNLPDNQPPSRQMPESRGTNDDQATAPTSQNNPHPPPKIPSSASRERARVRAQDWSWLLKSALNSPTGLALLHTKTPDSQFTPRLAIAPPFPIKSKTETTDRETLLQSFDPPLHVAIILIRYGYVAIAIAHDETLVISKTDTRWVPNQHRAGGQSANRFKRSREKWAREFFDKSARLAQERFAAYPHHIDHLIFGGDQHVIKQFLDRATLPNNLADRILQRRVNTLRPNRNALKDAVRRTWSSTIYELAERAHQT